MPTEFRFDDLDLREEPIQRPARSTDFPTDTCTMSDTCGTDRCTNSKTCTYSCCTVCN
jgi:hypothetical protein